MSEYGSALGFWYHHSLIESSKLDRMATNERATHENKARAKNQFISTFIVGDGISGDDAAQIDITNAEPSHTVLLFGVRVVGPDEIAGISTTKVNTVFPIGGALSPFTRPPVVDLGATSFYIPTGAGSSSWQQANLATAVDWSFDAQWVLTALAMPDPSVSNFQTGLSIALRTAGFDGTAAANFPANAWIYLFFHALGPVAAYP